MNPTDTPNDACPHCGATDDCMCFSEELKQALAASNAEVKRLKKKFKRAEKAETEVERLRAIIAQLIHYPECWDTACYETMDDAIHEIPNLRDCFDCQCDECEFNEPTN